MRRKTVVGQGFPVGKAQGIERPLATEERQLLLQLLGLLAVGSDDHHQAVVFQRRARQRQRQAVTVQA